jgi:hypothetical protein
MGKILRFDAISLTEAPFVISNSSALLQMKSADSPRAVPAIQSISLALVSVSRATAGFDLRRTEGLRMRVKDRIKANRN